MPSIEAFVISLVREMLLGKPIVQPTTSKPTATPTAKPTPMPTMKPIAQPTAAPVTASSSATNATAIVRSKSIYLASIEDVRQQPSERAWNEVNNKLFGNKLAFYNERYSQKVGEIVEPI